MKNKDFIKKYGKDNLKSLIDSITITLAYLKSKKEIPAYKINTSKMQVIFYRKGDFKVFDIAELFFMEDEQIIAKVKDIGKEVLKCE